MADIEITISDVGGAQRAEATVPDNAPVIRVIVGLVKALNLPVNGPDGTPLSYKLHHIESGRQLKDESTLAEGGVVSGHNVRLIPEIVAG